MSLIHLKTQTKPTPKRQFLSAPALFCLAPLHSMYTHPTGTASRVSPPHHTNLLPLINYYILSTMIKTQSLEGGKQRHLIRQEEYHANVCSFALLNKGRKQVLEPACQHLYTVSKHIRDGNTSHSPNFHLSLYIHRPYMFIAINQCTIQVRHTHSCLNSGCLYSNAHRI